MNKLARNQIKDSTEIQTELQLVFSAITGYEGTTEAPCSSARDPYYFELTTNDEKINQIREYASGVYEIDLSDADALRIFNAIESEKNELADWDRAFCSLAK